MENFEFYNPVRILFGKGTIDELSKHVPEGKKVLITYGGGSIFKNSVYDKVIKALKGYSIVEFGGIEPNPLHETCMKAVELIKKENVDFILAVGGGSVIDASKYIAAAINFKGDPWDIMDKGAEIDIAIAAIKAHPSSVMCLVIGNETDRYGPGFVDPSVVAGYMDYAHSKLNAEGLLLSLTSCITGGGADSTGGSGAAQVYARPILQKCKELNKPHHQVILLNIYPYYGNGQAGNIADNMKWSYEHGMNNAENNFGLEVMIGEIGWPTGTNNNGTSTSRENVANAETNFKTTLKWVDGENYLNQAYNSFWFEMFDEPWKTNEPNGVGPSWGIYEANGATTPKFTIPPLQ